MWSPKCKHVHPHASIVVRTDITKVNKNKQTCCCCCCCCRQLAYRKQGLFTGIFELGTFGFVLRPSVLSKMALCSSHPRCSDSRRYRRTLKYDPSSSECETHKAPSKQCTLGFWVLALSHLYLDSSS